MKKNLININFVAFCLLLLVACGGESNPTEGNNQQKTEKHTLKSSQPKISETGSSEENSTIEPFDRPAPELRDQVNTLLVNYISIKDELVESSSEGASEAAGQLLNNMKAFQGDGLPEQQIILYGKHIEDMKKFVRNISEKKDLEVQREHFSAITDNMYALAKAFKANQENLYYQYCPMAFKNNGGYWLSNAQEIQNPYFGEKMMNCGSVTEVIKR